MRRKDKILDIEPETPPSRLCDHPACDKAGDHRAPKGRDRLNEFYWFCMDHVRAYNRAWNYYQGMQEQEIEAEIRNDTVWRRPTWPMGGKVKNPRTRFEHAIFEDAFGVFEDRGPEAEAQPEPPSYDAELRRSFIIMEIQPPITLTELKTRYKELVKQLHPDVNGGDPAAEDRLKEINQAYAALKKVVPT
ncbi:MAG TPA: molecular chaperone DnaJ [Rhodospirillaceae bacterium]|nr:molecular chaperone DnaJ [Rhodospirillaceae bacterium]HAA92468.1 molecular chaperone DnaJ [Rhodospirillaceae bacterium]HAT36437.1 molecular chaperone DnaJ [Rhodospirillaceae bacterium]